MFKINNKNKRAMLLTPCMVNLGSISITLNKFSTLTLFTPMFDFYTKGFLMFSGGILILTEKWDTGVKRDNPFLNLTFLPS